jgi:hypothetical protein
MRLNLWITLLLILILGVSCAEKKSDAPTREGEAAGPERAIDKPLNAERITEEEMTAAGKAAAKNMFVESPGFPFGIGLNYAYKFTRGETELGLNRFKFSMIGTDGYVAETYWTFTGPDGEEWGNETITKYSFGVDLRPKLYARSMIDRVDLSHSMVLTKDFQVDDPYGIEQRSGRSGEYIFIELPAPGGDAWPYSENELAEMAIIFPCIKPDVTDVSVPTVDFDRAALAQLNLTLKGEQPIILMEQAVTMTAHKYEATIDGMVIGSFYVDNNMQLIAAELPGGVHAELLINVAE